MEMTSTTSSSDSSADDSARVLGMTVLRADRYVLVYRRAVACLTAEMMGCCDSFFSACVIDIE